MSRRAVRPSLIEDADPIRWFVRLERAVREEDYPLAALARDRLFDLGWRVAHDPPEDRPTARKAAVTKEGAVP
jgi:hypothetical protein